MAVHSILPPALTAAVAEVLDAAGIRHADVIVLAGVVGEPENERVRALAPLPVIAFDGIQGETFPDQDVTITLVYAPGPTGVPEARRAAEIVARADGLDAIRAAGFDAHGDPLDPLVRFERYAP